MSLGYIGKLITGTIKEWIQDNAKTYSAALAYYFVLSLPSLLLFSVSVGSLFLRSKQIQDVIISNLQGFVDQSVIDMISSLFEYIPEVNSLSIGALIGFVILLWSASNVFRQMKKFLEVAWDIEPAGSSTVKDFIKGSIVSFFVVIVFGGLLALSIIVEGVLYAVFKSVSGVLPLSSDSCPIRRFHSQLSDPCPVFHACLQGFARYKNGSKTRFCRVAGNSNSHKHRQICYWVLFLIQQPC